jgi:non-heme chloroperoxidase
MKLTNILLKTSLVSGALVMGALVAAIAFGGPKAATPMASINDPFKSVDFSDLPPLSHYQAEDGAALAYRRYRATGGAPKGSVVIVHGSSASSSSMHPLAKAFAQAGYDAYALDMRGHGESGVKGHIAYVGQLEDDVAAFVKAASLPKPVTLVGFSAGGGFALRFAGSQRQNDFQGYLLLSPFLSQEAPNYRAGSGGWVQVGIPRIVAITVLNRLGIRQFNDLIVSNFALNEAAKAFLTPAYSYALATNFKPLPDYEANISAVHQPVAVVAGASDEVFKTDELDGIFRKQGKTWPVTLLPGVGHILLTLDSGALTAAVNAVESTTHAHQTSTGP